MAGAPDGPRALVPGAPAAIPPAGSGAPGGLPGGPSPRGAAGTAAARQRDFLLLTVYVLAQQGYVDRAGILAEALYLTGDESPDVLLARSVLRFFAQDWAAALACLEELDRRQPLERFGSYSLDARQRMRRYLKARCLHELDDVEGARDAAQVYLRHR